MKKQKLTRNQKLKNAQKVSFALALTYLTSMVICILNGIFREENNLTWALIAGLFFFSTIIAWAVGVVIGLMIDKP